MQVYARRQEEERDRMNLAAWLQGVYTARAISANFGKGVQYFDKPIALGGEEKPADDAAVLQFEAYAAVFNRKFA